jgi:putative chitinase
MKVSKDAIMAGVGCSEEIAALWLPALEKACEEFMLKTPEEIAALLALIGKESDGLSSLVEKSDYTAEELCVLWPFKYALDSHVEHKTPNALAYMIGSKPERVANNIYAQRLGNGKESTGDGWKFRGRGPLRLCGRAAFAGFWRAARLDPATDPATLERPENGSLSAAFIFVGVWKKVVESGGFKSKVNDEKTIDRYTIALAILTTNLTPKEK